MFNPCRAHHFYHLSNHLKALAPYPQASVLPRRKREKVRLYAVSAQHLEIFPQRRNENRIADGGRKPLHLKRGVQALLKPPADKDALLQKDCNTQGPQPGLQSNHSLTATNAADQVEASRSLPETHSHSR